MRLGRLLLLSACITLPEAEAASLEEATAITLRSNPDVLEVFNRYKSFEQLHQGAEAEWRPSVDLRGNTGIGEVDSPSTRDIFGEAQTEQDYQLSVVLSQLIFDGFFTSEEIKRTDYERAAERFALIAEAENTALRVAEVYLEVLKQQELRKLAQKNLDSHQAVFDQIKLRAESGLGSSSDLSQITGRLAKANANLISADNNLRDAIANYRRVVGERPSELVMPVPDAELLPENKASLIQQARGQHPTLRSALLDVKAAQAEAQAARSGDYPTVTFELSATHEDDFSLDNRTTDELRAELKLNYNLFDGGRVKAKKREAAYRRERAKEVRNNAERQLMEGATLAWQAKDSLQRQLEYLQVHVEQSFATKEAYKEQFDLGRRSLLDLLDTENELFEARKAYVSAEIDYLLAQYRVLNAAGSLLSAFRIDLSYFLASATP